MEQLHIQTVETYLNSAVHKSQMNRTRVDKYTHNGS